MQTNDKRQRSDIYKLMTKDRDTIYTNQWQKTEVRYTQNNNKRQRSDYKLMTKDRGTIYTNKWQKTEVRYIQTNDKRQKPDIYEIMTKDVDKYI